MASGEMSETEFTDFLTKVCQFIVKNSKPGSVAALFMDWRHTRELLRAGDASFSELLNICAWIKHNAGMGSLYRSQHEFAFIFKNGNAPHINNIQLGKYGRHRSNAWQYAGVNNFGRSGEEGNLLAMHPTVKPVQMLADAILDCSNRGGVVLDPFLGSGSTLMACERTGRHGRGIEIDPLYVDTAIRRWQKYTGDQAVNVATGRTFADHEAEVAHV
jgi:DNA modification methylase